MSNSKLVDYTKLSPNHSGKRTHSIDRISPHCVVGQLSAETIGSIFASKSRQASCNYGIDKNGRVALIVDEDKRSWCTSSSANDQRAITIEIASDTKHPYAMNDKAYNAFIDLCVDICKRNGKKKLLWFADKTKTLNYKPKSDEMIFTVHRWFANKSCPGDWLYNRLDDVAKEVNERLTESKVKIGHAVRNEDGDYTGGTKGDQDSKEIRIDEWYLHSKGWYILRAKDPKKAEKLAKAMEELCANNYVGYCTTQTHRINGFNEAKKVNFDLSKIKTKCELDCSQSVRVCVHAAGIECEDFRTENGLKVLKATGEFEVLTSDKYCKSSDYLKRGDIAITRTKGHVIVILSNGKNATKSTVTSAISSTISKIDTVKEVQTWLNKNYDAGLKVDNDYGQKTKTALIKALQVELNQAYKTKLVVDGVFDSKTKGVIKTLKPGAKGDLVKILQALLICHGYTSAYLDGDYGKATSSAVKEYKKKKKFSLVNSNAGKAMFESLCK